MAQPREKARETIDDLLSRAGWTICDKASANISAHRDVAIRFFQLKSGHGEGDYMLYVDGKAAGVIEAKKEGTTLTDVEPQSAKYTKGLPDGSPAGKNPLPFAYESTGIEMRFTNGLDPAPRSRIRSHRNILKEVLAGTVSMTVDRLTYDSKQQANGHG